MRSTARILIAHQGTIPSYRVPFYCLLDKQRPRHWSFHVVCSNPESYHLFPTRCAPLRSLPFNLQWQNFLPAARHADVLILDTHLRNLGYLVAASLRQKFRPLILWGHTHNMNQPPDSPLGGISGQIKAARFRSCDMFFAYTATQADAARGMGLSESQIQVLNNTVDIEGHRSRFLSLAPNRESIRQTLGFKPEDRVALVVSRLLPEKRIRFLCDTFKNLAADKSLRLVVVGDGPESLLIRQLQQSNSAQVLAPGAIENPDHLSRYYVSADTFIMPGSIGLAPLEAICYNLPIIGFHLPNHGPEFEYLSPENSHILSGSISPSEFAEYLKQRMSPPTFRDCFPNAYESISHLRLQTMVDNFIAGVNRVLSQHRDDK